LTNNMTLCNAVFLWSKTTSCIKNGGHFGAIIFGSIMK